MHRLKTYEEKFNNYMNDMIMSAENAKDKREIMQKKIHSLEVERYVLAIADKLDDKYRFLVAVAALFHDIGKFSYGDEGHGLKAVMIIREKGLLDELDKNDYYMIVKMILFHSEKELPYFVENKLSLHTKILMDADRLAHMSLAAAISASEDEDRLDYLKDTDDEVISEKLMKNFIYGKTVKRKKLKNSAEVLANSMVTVIKQLNYNKSLKIVREEHLLGRIYSSMPQTEQTKLVYEMCVMAIDRRLNNV